MNGSEAAPSPTCRGLFGPERVGEVLVSDPLEYLLIALARYLQASGRNQ